MKKLLACSLLLLSSVLPGMNESSPKQRGTNQEQALLELAALSSGKSTQEIKVLQVLNMSDIKEVYRHESGNFINYSATLKNYDTISADYFVAGPMSGQYDCCRIIEHDGNGTTEISLPSQYYHVLKKIYEEHLNK